MSRSPRMARISQLVREEGVRSAGRTIAAYVAWQLRGKPTFPDEYVRWTEAADGVRPDDRDPMVGFSIVMPVFDTDPGFLTDAVRSVQAQTHASWKLIMVDDCSRRADTVRTAQQLAASDERIRLVLREENGGIAAATNTGVAEADQAWIAFMDHDDLLHPHALEWFSSVASDADMIYSDEDKVDVEGNRYSPTWKPAWSPRLLLGINYINHLTAVRADTVRAVGGIRTGFDGAQDHDFMLRISEIPDLRVVHLPNVLYHWRIWSESYSQTAESSLNSESSGLKAVGEAVERRGWNATAGLGRGTPFNYRPRFDETSPRPSVKVVIPTRDRVNLLRSCVDSLVRRTDGVDLHLVIVDNGSVKASTLAFLDELSGRSNVTVHRVDDVFNFSLLCNVGARCGPQTDFLLFLNNDVELLARRWLQQLTGWLIADPGVCAVGTKLYDAERTIQHGGVVLGLGGVAGHYADGLADQPVLNIHHDQVREVSAVTAALMVVRSEDFARVDGFNEDLPLVYQDVDLCLRLALETGGSVLYDPTFAAAHVGSASREKYDPAQTYGVLRFQMLWRDRIAAGDPFYSPHFSHARSDFSLAELPEDDAEFARRFQPRFGGSQK